MEANHTPGPWDCRPEMEFDGERPNWSIIDGDDNEIGTAYAGWTEEHSEANARLMTAAPELLEACRAAKKYLEPDLVEPGRTVFWALVAAIAKAEGRDAV